MNSHFLSSAQRTLSLSLSSPLLTPMVNLKELTNTQEDEEEEKAIQVTELKTRYNQRLMRPLQLNRRVKNYDNMGMINSGRQRLLIKHTITREDNEGKQLARQARELSKIAARHDKEAGVLKRKLKKIENRNFLEEHLEGDTVECIKAINERAEKLKRVRSLEDKKLYMLAMKKKQQEEEEQQNAENKDPLEMIQKQIEDSNLEKAEKEIQQIKLRLKQMNSNTQFRHVQRKLLLMRSMEASTINGQDETGESINDGEEKRNLLKSGSMLLKLEASPLLPHSVLHEKSNNTTLSGQDKPGRTFMKSKSTLNTSMNPNKEKNAYKSYDLVGSKRERRTYFVETDGSLEVSSVGLVTPPYIFSANELNLRPSEIDLPLDTEMNCQNDNDLSPHAKRILSQPTFKDGRNIEIFEREEEQHQNNRMNVLRGILIQENEIPAEQEKKPRTKRPKLFVRTGKDEGSKGIITSGESSKTPLYHNRENSSKKLIPQIEHSVTEVGDRFIRRPKDGYRLNLLDNMRKSKEIKTATAQESSNESSQAPKRWLGLTQASLLDAYKWKDRERIGKRGKTKKNIKGNFGKSTREEITITDSDNKIFLRELSAEKKPVKEEVQGLLTRYGYEESKADIVNGMTSKTIIVMRTPTGYGENREKLNRVEKFLHKAFQKSTRYSQVE